MDLLRRLREDPAGPLYVVCGEEGYLRDQAVQIIRDRVLDPATRDFNYDVFDGAEVDVAMLYGRVTAFPMMAERRLVLVRNAGGLSKQTGEMLVQYVDGPLESTTLVLEGESLPARGDLSGKLKKWGVWAEFKPLFPRQVAGWIREYARSCNRAIEADAAAALAELVGTDLRTLTNELEKLWVSVGDTIRVTREDIFDVVGVSRTHNIFELTTAVGMLETGQALEIVQRMLERGEKPIGMIVMLARHLAQLYRVTQAPPGLRPRELASKFGIHPFYVESYIAQARNYAPQALLDGMRDLLEADLRLKSTGHPPLLVMQVALLAILRRGKTRGAPGRR